MRRCGDARDTRPGGRTASDPGASILRGLIRREYSGALGSAAAEATSPEPMDLVAWSNLVYARVAAGEVDRWSPSWNARVRRRVPVPGGSWCRSSLRPAPSSGPCGHPRCATPLSRDAQLATDGLALDSSTEIWRRRSARPTMRGRKTPVRLRLARRSGVCALGGKWRPRPKLSPRRPGWGREIGPRALEGCMPSGLRVRGLDPPGRLENRPRRSAPARESRAP